ncbi:[LysW]-aminoadipate kinase [Kitasatospora sp. NPDC057223]|uniref:[LysW]-aminoadipate kinase n=1 Tax=Kitasatospora sp. NPDC057223 TaxID=3346055 RepID=UPI0036336EC6
MNAKTAGIAVVKCGGNAAVDAAAVCADVAAVHGSGRSVVLVHGGSADIDRIAARMGVPGRRLTAPDGVSTRYTDSDTLEVVLLALAGAVKPRLVAALGRHGVRAVGLTGLDGGLLRARRRPAQRAVVDGRVVLVRDNHTGTVRQVDTALLHTLLDAGIVPVVSPPAVDEDGRPVNVDADRAAAAIASALGAEELVLLTGAPGLLADPGDPASVLAEYAVPAEGLPDFAGGGMALKLVAAREAVRGGVGRVRIADGRGARPLSDALSGAGTSITVAAQVLPESAGVAS